MKEHNLFTALFQKKSNKDLEYIISNPSDFDQKAVQAAIWILEERGGDSEQTKRIQEEINSKQEKAERKIEDEIGIPISTQDWKIRFLHAIIDAVLIQGIVYIVALIPSVSFNMLFAFALYPVYYLFFETNFRQTPGKMVTDSIVTNSSGEAPGIKSIILRTAARYIPFEGLSCLGNPSWGWHDKWTRTYVVRKSDLEKIRG